MQKRLGVTSLNLTIGRWQENLSLIKSCIEQAEKRQLDIVVFPELSLTGVNLRDRFQQKHTLDSAQAGLQALLPYSKNRVIIVGLPIHFESETYNVAAVLYHEKVQAYIPKTYPLRHLEEERYFSRWPHALICHVDDVPCGFIKTPIKDIPELHVFVGNLEELKGTESGDLMVQVCAKPYYMGQYLHGLNQVREFAKEHQITILRSAYHGSDDGTHIYDGASFLVKDGEILGLGQRFDFHHDAILTTHEDGVHNCFDPSLAIHASTSSFPQSAVDHEYAELELALCLGLHDYLRRTGIEKLCLALSGGRDSAMVAILIARTLALRYPALNEAQIRDKMRHFLICAYMPTQNSSIYSEKAALVLASELGASCYTIPIDEHIESIRKTVQDATQIKLHWSEPQQDLTLQNLQARTRSTLIWTIANAHNALLMVNSNLSEAAVGYTTMDGDSSGGLNLIANLPKTLVSSWLHWAMVFHRLSCLQLVLQQKPSAELRPIEAHQNDEEDLMPYMVLDSFIQAFLVQRLAPIECCIKCWPTLKDVCKTRKTMVTYLKKFIRMSCAAQWKRVRLANGFRVLPYNLDADHGLRWPVVQDAFTDQLPILDEWSESDD